MTDAFTAPGRFLRGNLHTHSDRSDGVLTPEEVCRRYRAEGYDFLALTDHFVGLFGYPITDEFTDPQSGLVTQYFERARFEWHPGAWPSRYDVELGLLGVELTQKQGLTGSAPFQPAGAGSSPNCTYYQQTSHWLCSGFREYWTGHGGLAIFGYPISEEFTDPATGLTVQYFERQRLEFHPENPPAWQVEGGLVGAQLLQPRK